MRIKAHTLLVIADGQSAVFFRNDGINGQIRLAEVRKFSAKTLASHEIGRGRPGRAHDSFSSSRSAYEQNDPHEQSELNFLSAVAGSIEEELKIRPYQDLVLIAPPTALSSLRNAISRAVRAKVSAEIHKDYTNTPAPDLENILRQIQGSTPKGALFHFGTQ